MSELLMQVMVEKLESIELLLKVEGNNEKDGELNQIKEELQLLQKMMKNLPSQFLLGSAKMGELSASINRLSELLQKPLNTRIEHKHELHKGFLISIGLFLVCLFLTWGWVDAFQTQNQFEANDIKYRFLKSSGTRASLKLCNSTDSLFQSDPVGFKYKVEQEEQKLIQQAEDLRLAGEKKRRQKN
jgi:hypothetical protein